MKNFKLMRHNFEMPISITESALYPQYYGCFRLSVPSGHFSEFNFYGISLTFGEYWATGLGFCQVDFASSLSGPAIYF